MVSTYIYLCIVVPGAVIQLKLVNHAMEVYNQAEIGPIYSSSLILLHMLCGGIILDEKALYSRTEILELLGYSMICILGIYIIARKPSCRCLKGNKGIQITRLGPKVTI
jgi:ATP/ADP translocase